jgi:predicted lipid-binding transport protein (Tim44 family)
MKRIALSLMALLLGVGFAVGEADAKKLGSGKPMGTQRNVTAPPASTPPARQAQQAAPAQAPAAQPASGLAKWAPMLGGLAIGGMLGALFAGQGFGGALGSILMIALLAFAAVFVVRLLMRGRAQPAAAGAGAGGQPMQYQGLGNETVAAPPPSQSAGFEAQPVPVATNVPAGFDVAGFVRHAKLSYIRLQGANDAGNLDEIRDFTTPEMFESLKADIAARDGARQTTDVVTLNADLLEVVTEGDRHWASVRFAGMVSETPGQAPVAFEEIWNLSKPVDGSAGWMLSGIQQMH